MPSKVEDLRVGDEVLNDNSGSFAVRGTVTSIRNRTVRVTWKDGPFSWETSAWPSRLSKVD